MTGEPGAVIQLRQHLAVIAQLTTTGAARASRSAPLSQPFRW